MWGEYNSNPETTTLVYKLKPEEAYGLATWSWVGRWEGQVRGSRDNCIKDSDKFCSLLVGTKGRGRNNRQNIKLARQQQQKFAPKQSYFLNCGKVYKLILKMKEREGSNTCQTSATYQVQKENAWNNHHGELKLSLFLQLRKLTSKVMHLAQIPWSCKRQRPDSNLFRSIELHSPWSFH